MKVLVLVKATAASERGDYSGPEMDEMFAAMGRFNEELRKAGLWVTAEGLKPSSAGKRVRFDGPNRSVYDGPFSDASELVAGFWIWEVKDMDEAVSWVRRCPNPMPGPSEIEIRPFETMEGIEQRRDAKRGETA